MILITMALSLAACGGSSGSKGDTGAPGATGADGADGADDGSGDGGGGASLMVCCLIRPVELQVMQADRDAAHHHHPVTLALPLEVF